jgi:VIT1/CCC1 family predicted Fe2+/Mn2+ transporter
MELSFAIIALAAAFLSGFCFGTIFGLYSAARKYSRAVTMAVMTGRITRDSVDAYQEILG